MKCIPVQMSDGTTVMATVDNNVDELDKSDIEQLEAWVKYVKAERVRKQSKLQANTKPKSELAHPTTNNGREEKL